MKREKGQPLEWLQGEFRLLKQKIDFCLLYLVATEVWTFDERKRRNDCPGADFPRVRVLVDHFFCVGGKSRKKNCSQKRKEHFLVDGKF